VPVELLDLGHQEQRPRGCIAGRTRPRRNTAARGSRFAACPRNILRRPRAAVNRKSPCLRPQGRPRFGLTSELRGVGMGGVIAHRARIREATARIYPDPQQWRNTQGQRGQRRSSPKKSRGGLFILPGGGKSNRRGNHEEVHGRLLPVRPAREGQAVLLLQRRDEGRLNPPDALLHGHCVRALERYEAARHRCLSRLPAPVVAPAAVPPGGAIRQWGGGGWRCLPWPP
jgi:hypothetical protein